MNRILRNSFALCQLLLLFVVLEPVPCEATKRTILRKVIGGHKHLHVLPVCSYPTGHDLRYRLVTQGFPHPPDVLPLDR